jgi:Pyridoxamine 5'-phosphate oxidase
VIVAAGASDTRPVVLPEWPASTIAVLSTLDDEPHAIPVTAPVRAGDRAILFSLLHQHESLRRLRERPEVAITILAEGDEAFTARERARIAEESMEQAPAFAAVSIDVQHVDALRVLAGRER